MSLIGDFVRGLPTRDWKALLVGAFDFEATSADPQQALIVQAGGASWPPELKAPRTGARWVNPQSHLKVDLSGVPPERRSA